MYQSAYVNIMNGGTCIILHNERENNNTLIFHDERGNNNTSVFHDERGNNNIPQGKRE